MSPARYLVCCERVLKRNRTVHQGSESARRTPFRAWTTRAASLHVGLQNGRLDWYRWFRSRSRNARYAYSQPQISHPVKYSLLATILLLLALDPTTSQAQNTTGDYAYVEEELSDVVSGTIGSGSGDYQVSERRIENDGISYERPFFGDRKYYIHSIGSERESVVRLTITCNNYRVLDESWSGNAVGASFEPPHGNTETCTIKSFVSRSSTRDMPHFIGMAIMYSEQNE